MQIKTTINTTTVPVIIQYLSGPDLPFNTCSSILGWIPIVFLLFSEQDVRLFRQRDLEVTAREGSLFCWFQLLHCCSVVQCVDILWYSAPALCPEFVVPKKTWKCISVSYKYKGGQDKYCGLDQEEQELGLKQVPSTGVQNLRCKRFLSLIDSCMFLTIC